MFRLTAPPSRTVTLPVVGDIDHANAATVSKLIDDAIAAGDARVVIDLSGIDYMSSRGLRALTTAKAKSIAAGVSIRLAAPNEIMREILAISRYDRLFDVDDAVPGQSA